MKNTSKEVTNLRTYVVSSAVFIGGVILLICAEWFNFSRGYLWLKSITSNFGALLIASVSIAMLWELFSKRSFLDELLAKTGLAEEIRTVGVTGFSLNPLRGPDFSKIIRSSERLDIFVCYANTWRANFEEDLKLLAQKKSCRIRLIVPDPDNMEIMKDLAKRFNASDAETMKGRINQAITEYKALFGSISNSSLDFSIWIHDETPVSSFYRFDRCAVITLYKHAKGRGNAPTIIADRGGALYTYIENEIDSMINGVDPFGRLARQIFPEIV
ncbi:hypothetical protein ABFO19_00715 [Xanthomonas citri pv. glycines]|uniref:hypothetical protein n=1 Tax=Xanthomonas TaxID=338 RepID=UPI000AA715FB|nr:MULTISPECIES: hypothetical protein [Xanthomonas]QDR43415.1 hypothetical protein FPK90_00755 [Xanthomonas citri pv. glycines]QDS05597.1 hypothetical protein FPL00_00755 [Xanthomonas citri pv. glycines]QDS09885.1 hypothetical protein FPL03_00755 [Xanthomonas citri pv. glycines]QDS18511.1 hypothetical protein FPL05_00915 [Xanthomonas citri pv. glycines]QTK34842.1 hypothetical protein XcgCFBP2526_00720 [Xanthomonas citri pv. glycines CFBP 2526]